MTIFHFYSYKLSILIIESHKINLSTFSMFHLYYKLISFNFDFYRL